MKPSTVLQIFPLLHGLLFRHHNEKLTNIEDNISDREGISTRPESTIAEDTYLKSSLALIKHQRQINLWWKELTSAYNSRS